jgi:hypothetical protein
MKNKLIARVQLKAEALRTGICGFGCLPTIKAGLSVNFYAIEVGKRDLSPLPSPDLSHELRFGSIFRGDLRCSHRIQLACLEAIAELKADVS